MGVKKRILTEEEFAKEVRWNPDTIGRLRRQKKIDHCRNGRKIWYLNPEHIESFNKKFERLAAA